VIHFAGLKAVGESQQIPLKYFENNISGSISLVQAMERAGVFCLVFSSSATVYGELNPSPYQEDMPLGMPTNNYGYTKMVVEQLLEKTAQANSQWSIALLRYFNPVGAHKSGQIGEDPQGIPNNLMPFVTQVAVGRREKLSIFGHDYPTEDGTCERDFIHVVDLAKAHVLAIQNRLQQTGCRAWNIGTGKPISVLAIKNTFEQVNGINIAFEYAPRRAGDLASFYADSRRATEELGWTAAYTLEDMLADSWNWQKQNPHGYG
jgi:UDP-glucose-4-epimerase